MRAWRSVRVIGCGWLVATLSGCALTPPQRLGAPGPAAQAIPVRGSYYVVQPGDTLWGIAKDFGLDVRNLAAANRVRDASSLGVGARLLLPLPTESGRFYWPVRGHVVRSTASSGGGKQGVDISAPDGTIVRASRTGLAAVATNRLPGWGRTILLNHANGYTTVYAGLEEILVAPGISIRQGTPIGRLGQAPLHFEIRRGTQQRDPLTLLP